MHMGYSAVGWPCAHIHAVARSPLSYLTVTSSCAVSCLSSRASVVLIVVVCLVEEDDLRLSWVAVVSGCHHTIDVSLLDMIWHCEGVSL